MARYFKKISIEEFEAKFIEVAKQTEAYRTDYRQEDFDDFMVSKYSSQKPLDFFARLALHYKALPSVAKDLKKVDFDCENFECEAKESSKVRLGIQQLDNGLVYLGCMGGGDWEVYVYYIVYWDGKNFRGYLPKDGNPWDKKEKRAYIDEDEYELSSILEKEENKLLAEDCSQKKWDKFEAKSVKMYSQFRTDAAKIEADIKQRIQLKV